MTLSAFTWFFYGILCEIIFLLESAGWVAPEAHSRPGMAGWISSPWRTLQGMLGVLALGAWSILQWSGAGQERVYIDTPVVNLLFTALGLFVLFAAFLVRIFLPAVNEQSILAAQSLMLLHALIGGEPVDWIPLAALTAVPALVCLGLVLWPRPLPPLFKAFLYLWYLLSLMAMPFQSGQAAFFRQLDFTPAEAWSFGSLLIFLVIHGLFAARFFLLVSSLIVPRNRPALLRLMPSLFTDEQVPPLRFLLAALLAGGLLLANRGLGLLPQPAALGLCVMLATQVLAARAQKPAPVPPQTPSGAFSSNVK